MVVHYSQVLLVDDDVAGRERIADSLADLGLQIDIAGDGERAVVLLIERPYSAVVINLGISGVDGEATVALMRGAGFSGPIIGIAGAGIDKDVAHYVEAGCTECLRLPVDAPTFAATLTKHLQFEAQRTEGTCALEDLPEFQELKHVFEGQLPERLSALQKLLEQCQWDAALHAAHVIKGQAGTFSYHGISEAANRIQCALIAGMSQDALDAAVELLQQDDIRNILEERGRYE